MFYTWHRPLKPWSFKTGPEAFSSKLLQKGAFFNTSIGNCLRNKAVKVYADI